MKRAFRNFITLSAKQVKTYAMIITMSIFSFEVMASNNKTIENRDPGMVVIQAIMVEEELVLENWMLTPFDVQLGEEPSVEFISPASAETFAEMEIAIENWMTSPFELAKRNDIPAENSTCAPAP